MSARVNPRGQPILVFATILGGWTILRVLMWTSPFPPALSQSLGYGEDTARIVASANEVVKSQPVEAPALPNDYADDRLPPWSPKAPLPAPLAADPDYPVPPTTWQSARNDRFVTPAPMRRIAGHHLLLAAGLSNMTLPPEVAAFYGQQPAAGRPARQLAVADHPLLAAPQPRSKGHESRWSADGWLLWRDGSAATAATPGVASYGRSQAGAVVRYRLSSGPLRPRAYARATRALEGARQSELAAGIALRAIAELPVSFAAEVRLTDTAAGREVRPAVFAVTELPAAKLPLGLRGEAYAQAGYVGGVDRTAFVDGQARVDGRLALLGNGGELRAGLGTWGGAQRGAARLDVGPSATVIFRLGEASSRLAVDYRLRVAGEAEPKSGPALTFSAGF